MVMMMVTDVNLCVVLASCDDCSAGDGKKKTLTLQDVLQQSQKSLFLRGRPRFHGAFTGGFSAGFFNTVGTMEGARSFNINDR